MVKPILANCSLEYFGLFNPFSHVSLIPHTQITRTPFLQYSLYSNTLFRIFQTLPHTVIHFQVISKSIGLYFGQTTKYFPRHQRSHPKQLTLIPKPDSNHTPALRGVCESLGTLNSQSSIFYSKHFPDYSNFVLVRMAEFGH